MVDRNGSLRVIALGAKRAQCLLKSADVLLEGRFTVRWRSQLGHWNGVGVAVPQRLGRQHRAPRWRFCMFSQLAGPCGFAPLPEADRVGCVSDEVELLLGTRRSAGVRDCGVTLDLRQVLLLQSRNVQLRANFFAALVFISGG
jgi:hypothetical protein